jgi:hypothetical protein
MYKDLVKDKTFPSLTIPPTMVPSPTAADYDNGFIVRYFTQKANDKNGFVYELSSDVYSDIVRNPHWTSITMRWRIDGPKNVVYNEVGKIIDKGVIDSNNASLKIASEKLKNIGLYLPNVLQFHK